jgi:hypothetical protein
MRPQRELLAAGPRVEEALSALHARATTGLHTADRPTRLAWRKNRRDWAIVSTSVEDYQARRVITGVGNDGRSCVAVDELAPTRAATPTFTVVDLWQTDSVPPVVHADDTLAGEVALDPPKTGVLVRIVTFPPDTEWQANGGYADAMAAIGGSDSHDDEGDTAGMHTTDTVDIITVIEGEIHAVLETDEVRLGLGDSLIQRGTKHAWSNRTNKRATIVATMYCAIR